MNINEVFQAYGIPTVFRAGPGTGATAGPDGGVQYASATTLTLDSMRYVPSSTVVFLAVIEARISDPLEPVKVYLPSKINSSSNYIFTWSPGAVGGTLTVTNASFTATSAFFVFWTSYDRALTNRTKIQGSTDSEKGEPGPEAPLLVAGRNYSGGYATIVMVSAGPNNDIAFFAREPGLGGNAITIRFSDGGAGSTLRVTLSGTAITLTGDIAAGVTANAAVDALRHSKEAMDLVSCALVANNDGTANIDAIAATNLAGGMEGERMYALKVNSSGAITEASAAAIAASLEKLISRLIAQMIGLPGVYSSPTDFTATYLAATQLTLTGMPTTPANIQFLGVIERGAGGAETFYSTDDYQFSFASATGILTVTTAAFDSLSTFTVIYTDQHRAYDSLLNTVQTAEMTARQLDIIDNTVLHSAAALSGALDSGWMYCKGETVIGVSYVWTLGAGHAANDELHVLQPSVYTNMTDAGTDEHAMAVQPLGTQYLLPGAAAGGTVIKRAETIIIPARTRFKIKTPIEVGYPSCTNKGTLTLSVSMVNQ